MKLLARLTLLVLLLLPVTAGAEIPPQMEADFATLGGRIIMPIGDEFLVDLDASANLQEGDILTLVAPGEKVIHPVTKELLGTLDVPKGFLQVSRIKSGYSYAKLLYSDVPPQKGDQIKRFEQVPTAFQAEPANAKLLSDLKTGLPQLDWQSAAAPEAILTFVLNGNQLTVKNSSGTTLRNYQLVDGELVVPDRATTPNNVFTVTSKPGGNKSGLNKVVDDLLSTIGVGQSRDLAGGPGIIRNKQALENQGIWMSHNLQGSPAGLGVAELDGDGQLETVVAMENHLLISQLGQGEISEEARVDLPLNIRVLSADVFDLDGNGTAEIYLSAAREHRLASLVVEYIAGEYQVTIDNIPWFLRVAEVPGLGRTLLGQRTGDQGQLFLGAPFKITRAGDELQSGEELPLPMNVSLFSMLPLSSDGSDSLLAYLSAGDYLKVVTTSGNELWESADYYGGTETLFYNTPIDDDRAFVTPIYIQKRILRGPSGEVLVAQNDGLRTLQRFRMFKDSRVVALTWNGFAMQETWRTSGMSGYLADFALADADNDGVAELVMVVKFKHENVLQDARSSLVLYELN